MVKSNEEKKEEKKEEKDVEIQKTSSEDKKKEKMMDSESDVYEIDELNSTIAPSSSRQCIVGAGQAYCRTTYCSSLRSQKI